MEIIIPSFSDSRCKKISVAKCFVDLEKKSYTEGDTFQ